MVDHVCGKLLGIAMLVIEVPSAKIEIGTPEECVGMLLGDLKSRAATIQAVDTQRNGVTIRAIAPLERMLGYATLVRSLSKGQATLSLEPHDWVVESAETETPL
jgi:elongation factor G